MSGLLVVLSGPSGVGKDTVIRRWKEINPDLLKVTTCTTRAPRSQEVAGLDYIFLTVSEFEQRIEGGAFLEYKPVFEHFYGTPASEADAALAQGKIALLKIDVKGGMDVKEKRPEAVMIFLAPPSFEELERRIRDRATDGEESIKVRLETARTEMDAAVHYEFYVVNDDVDRAVAELDAIVRERRGG